MKKDVIVFNQMFDENLEQILDAVNAYLSALVEIRPDAVLEVSTSIEDKKAIWTGRIVEPREWGEEDLYYGYIKIIPISNHRLSLSLVQLYCSEPKYITYWSGFGKTLSKHLTISDVSHDLIDEPWKFIPDKGYDQQMLELWHKDVTAPEIGIRIGVSPRTIYDRLRLLRVEYGEEIVPFHHPAYKRSKSP